MRLLADYTLLDGVIALIFALTAILILTVFFATIVWLAGKV